MSALAFYLDFISPYSYLAWTQVDRVARARGRDVDQVPVLFGAMLDAFGTIGPAEVPTKREYVYLDVHRKAALLGVPLRLPPRHPFAPLFALRAATSFEDRGERAKAVDALFRAAWATGAGLDSLPSLEAFLDGRDVITAELRAAVRAVPVGIERKRK